MCLGAEVVIHKGMEDGDPDFIDYWERYQRDPTNFAYTNIGKALERMKEEQVVLHVIFNSLKSFYRLK